MFLLSYRFNDKHENKSQLLFLLSFFSVDDDEVKILLTHV